jgi:hypothetical protein
VLLSVPGGGYSYTYPAQTGSKLFIWVYNNAISPITVNTLVYSIPGQVSNGLPELPADQKVSVSKAFPNPSNGTVTIPYTLPANVNQAELKLFDMSGKMVKSYIVDHTFDNIQVQTNELPAGMYLYQIEADGYKTKAYKLSVSK